MLTITNIDKLHNEVIAHNGSNWMITKININDNLDYYGIVIRKEPVVTSNEYVVFYLMRDSIGYGEYEMHSNKSTTKRVVHISDIEKIHTFKYILQREISRLC